MKIIYDRFFDLLILQTWGVLGIAVTFVWTTFSLLISLAKM
ncbi:hypothetical Protein YC6258_03510 [Gynuella sunshinyii YC6258]|uniref:Uncharacterized protein n=2 Tax=Gynuella sunshinyii TaxID=1445505 RepID=A0A0C5VMK4_9GAMM|nr:hypothetical Protein YC6258_03510 [Gynuella sunshinyii YC6258]